MVSEYLWVSPTLNDRSVYDTSRVSITGNKYTAPETAELNVANGRPQQVWGLRIESLNLEIQTANGTGYDLTLNRSTQVRPFLDAIKEYGRLSGVAYPLDIALKFVDIQGVVVDGNLVGIVMNHPPLDFENDGPRDAGLIDQ